MMDDTNIVSIKIYDARVPEVGTPIAVEVTAASDPLVIRTGDSSRDKFTPVKAKIATIRILASNPITASHFFDAVADNNFYVEITIIGGPTLFKGYLSLADISQDFLPDPNVLTLTASDHLGMLKDVPLTTATGGELRGKYKLSEIIALCLKKTGLELDIKVINNLRHGTGQRTVGTVNFSNASSTIFFPLEVVDMFYPNQEIEVTGGSVLNLNSKFVVTSFNSSGSTSNIIVSPAPVTESGVTNVTFKDTSSQGHFYDKVYVDAKSFENQIGELEDCYTILSKILGEDCSITQVNGQWWIYRVDEYDNTSTGGLIVATFNSSGVYQSIAAETNYNKEIGRTETMKSLADRQIFADRPHGTVIETFDYDDPLELVDNIDFSRGALLSTVSAVEKRYVIDDWTLVKDTTLVPNTTAYTKATLVDGYETERYVVIPAASGNGHYLISEPFPMGIADKFSFTVDRKYTGQFSGPGSGFYRHVSEVQIRLYADDGTYYAHRGATSATPSAAWVQTNNVFSPGQYHVAEGDFSDDDTEWKGIYSGEVSPLPKSGVIRIVLFHFDDYTTLDKHISNLSITYKPYIKGTYARYTGQSQTITRTPEDYMAKRDERVYLSDAPRKLYKGAMFFINKYNTVYSGATTFLTGNSEFQILGYKLESFRRGQHIKITGTVSNNQSARVTSVSYNSGSGFTIVKIDGTTTNETVAATIAEAVFPLTVKFFPYNRYPTGLSQFIPYGEHQIRSVFNQYRNANRVFDGRVLGNYDTGDTPLFQTDLIHKYYLTDSNPNTDNKYFLCVDMEQDWKTGIWRGVFIEVFDTVVGKSYTDTREFKYLTA